MIIDLGNPERKSAVKINATNLQNQDCAVHHLLGISTMSLVGVARNSFMVDAKETITTLRQSKSVKQNARNQVSRKSLYVFRNLKLKTGN